MEFNLRDVQAPTFTVPIQPKVKSKAMNYRKVIVVASSGKGGPGKTTTAVNLALHFQQGGYRTVLLDFDTPLGDVASMLRIADDRCLTSWLEVKTVLQPQFVDNMLMETEEGLKVLPSIREADEEKLVNNSDFAKMILENVRHFEVVIVDAAPNFSELTMEACRQATDILMVSDGSQVSLNNIQRGIKHLKKENIEVSKVALMVNKLLKKQTDKQEKYGGLTGIRDVLEVPFEPKMQEWTNQGFYPMIHKKNSKFSQALMEYAEELLPSLADEPRKKSKRSLFSVFGWGK
ncbi:MAG TPA: P-loop NTPase [Bacillus sp. (in: firmicutes)]|nr:P-loop NTPase [Bacillus sp. (in: firmicutes)]